MAITLIDYFKQSKDPESAAFISDLLRNSNLMGIIPFVDTDGFQVEATRWQTVPATAFRTIGSGYTESTGNTEQLTETVFAVGGDVKVDRLFTKAKNTFEQPLQTQMKMKAQSIAFTFNNYLINGDHAVDADGFEGVKKRISNMPTRMTINLDSNQAGTGSSLKVFASTANINLFLDSWHKAKKYVDGATHILVNESTYLGLAASIRRASPAMFDTTKDNFDREIMTFMGLPIIDVGLLKDKSTEIITTSEDPGNGTLDATSAYFVRIDTEDGLHGLQLAGTSPEPYDPLTGGELESGPQYLRRIDWAVGLINVSNYCMARVKGFKMASS